MNKKLPQFYIMCNLFVYLLSVLDILSALLQWINISSQTHALCSMYSGHS